MAVKPPNPTDPAPNALRHAGAALKRQQLPNTSFGLRRPATTPARLTHDANFYRAAHARRMGFDSTPDFNDMLEGAPAGGASLAELMPSARAHGHPDLPEVETRPPPFLSPLAAMKDIYVRMKGRASPKTVDLLEGVDLEDLLAQLKALFENDALRNRGDARLAPALHAELKAEPGPFLLGLHDPRLTELWRVFLDGWDIWIPEGRDNGVELFWEGEGENDRGRAIEAMQSLAYVDGDIVLHTRLGDLEDRLTFDGAAFYRLRLR